MIQTEPTANQEFMNQIAEVSFGSTSGVCPRCGHCPHCGRGNNWPRYYGPWWGVTPPAYFNDNHVYMSC